jgi:hypothetical protein
MVRRGEPEIVIPESPQLARQGWVASPPVLSAQDLSYVDKLKLTVTVSTNRSGHAAGTPPGTPCAVDYAARRANAPALQGVLIASSWWTTSIHS